jgi:hypothetical protein
MSLPTLLKTALAVMAGWTLLRVTHRVERLEMHTGVWRTQVKPTGLLKPSSQITDEEFGRLVDTWRREFGRDAA